MTKKKIFNFVLLLPFLLGFNNFDNITGGENKSSGSSVAIVQKVVKDVTLKRDGDQDNWEKAKLGISLSDGGEVKTGDKSLALINFTDGSGILRVRENSILNIYGEKKDKRVNKNTFVQKGLIRFEVNKQNEDEEFKFTTPTVVASIRGTNGFLEFDDDSTFTMSLDNGSALLNFLGPGGGDGSLNGGNTVIITPDGEFNYREQNEDDKNKSDQSQSEPKKIRVRTPDGELEIDYYGPKN